MTLSQETAEIFWRLRRAILTLEEEIGEAEGGSDEVRDRILLQRTERIAREPVRVDRAPDTIQCMLFERSGRKYAVRLEALLAVAPLESLAAVPGIPDSFLGVTARRGRIVSVVDLPVLFGGKPNRIDRPRWMVVCQSEEVVCAVAADDVRDITDIDKESMAGAMPTFPALVQRHTVGVLEDGTVVLDLIGLLEDKALRVEDRGA